MACLKMEPPQALGCLDMQAEQFTKRFADHEALVEVQVGMVAADCILIGARAYYHAVTRALHRDVCTPEGGYRCGGVRQDS
jgi:hypothetical protein